MCPHCSASSQELLLTYLVVISLYVVVRIPKDFYGVRTSMSGGSASADTLERTAQVDIRVPRTNSKLEFTVLQLYTINI
jgi:hypothetical protein